MAKVKSMMESIEERYSEALRKGHTTSVTRSEAIQLLKDTFGMLDTHLRINGGETMDKLQNEAIEKLTNDELVKALIDTDRLYKSVVKSSRLGQISKLVS